MSACSFLSYTKQQQLLDYYEKRAKSEIPEESNGKHEQHEHGLAANAENPQHLTSRDWSRLQEQSLTASAHIHQIRASMHIPKSLRRTPLKEKERRSESTVKVYDASLPYRIAHSTRNDDPITGPRSKASFEAFENLKKADRFYREFLNVFPVNSPKKEILGYVKDQDTVNNATWDGLKFRFGIADETLIKGWTDVDIVLHEVGHAVTTYTTDFTYKGQSGALNESVSDIFAIIYKHRENKTLANAPDADWTIAKIVVDGNSFAPLRSFAKPGSAYPDDCPLALALGPDSQVSHMRQYFPTKDPSEENDFGGVHDYSGIPNHAFYLAAKNLQGSISDTVGPIWWDAIQEAKVNDGFAEFAQLTISSAKKQSSNAENAVRKAWEEVGVTRSGPLNHLTRIFSGSNQPVTISPNNCSGLGTKVVIGSAAIVATAAVGAIYYHHIPGNIL